MSEICMRSCIFSCVTVCTFFINVLCVYSGSFGTESGACGEWQSHDLSGNGWGVSHTAQDAAWLGQVHRYNSVLLLQKHDQFFFDCMV